MTDNEIIEALERCGYHKECCFCNSVEECGGKNVLVTNALDLITRQQAEIERLKINLNVEFDNFVSEYDDKIKAEAVKDFAERLKEETLTTDKFGEILLVQDIDNLVKEIIGE